MRKYITFDEAVSLLPNEEYIHTFYNTSFGLIGADWSKAEILDKLQKSEIIELTGETARSMGHGMCAYNKDTKYQKDILFIQTNKEKLLAFDKSESTTMPDQLTDSEIAKVLECFVNEECPDCERCSYYDYCRKNRVYIDVFDLINRLQAKNSNLTSDLTSLQNDLTSLRAENRRLSTLAELGNTRANDYRVMRDRALKAEAENEQLAKDKENLAYSFANAVGQKITVKAEAYKECIEKVKEIMHKYCGDITEEDLDNLLKELVGAERTGTFPTINNELGEDK